MIRSLIGLILVAEGGLLLLALDRGDGPSAAALEAEAMFAPEIVDVVAGDFTFEAPRAAGEGRLRLRLENRGTELHQVRVVRLLGGRAVADLTRALEEGAEPAWAVDAGGPVAAPGSRGEVVLTLPAGDYALVCVVPSADGTRHYVKGMTRPFTVLPSSGITGPSPRPDLTLDLVDGGHQLSAPLRAGAQRVLVRNPSARPHEVVVVRLAPGARAADALAWAMDAADAVPGEVVGGMAALAPGRHGELPLDLPPGRYALLCLGAHAPDGRPHAPHGSAQALEVR